MNYLQSITCTEICVLKGITQYIFTLGFLLVGWQYAAVVFGLITLIHLMIHIHSDKKFDIPKDSGALTYWFLCFLTLSFMIASWADEPLYAVM